MELSDDALVLVAVMPNPRDPVPAKQACDIHIPRIRHDSDQDQSIVRQFHEFIIIAIFGSLFGFTVFPDEIQTLCGTLFSETAGALFGGIFVFKNVASQATTGAFFFCIL